MKMEERVKLLKEMKETRKKESVVDIQAVHDEITTARKISKIQEDDLRKLSVTQEDEPPKEVGNKVRFSENSVEVNLIF